MALLEEPGDSAILWFGSSQLQSSGSCVLVWAVRALPCCRACVQRNPSAPISPSFPRAPLTSASFDPHRPDKGIENCTTQWAVFLLGPETTRIGLMYSSGKIWVFRAGAHPAHGPDHVQGVVGIRIVSSAPTCYVPYWSTSRPPRYFCKFRGKKWKNNFFFDDLQLLFPYIPNHRCWIKFGRILLNECIEI